MEAMAGFDAATQTLLAALSGSSGLNNNFGLNPDDSLVDNFVDNGSGNGLGTPDANSVAATLGDTPASSGSAVPGARSGSGFGAVSAAGPGAGAGGSGTSSSVPPSAVTASLQLQQQPAFFNPVPPTQWVFQDTPPYDSPSSAGSPFGNVPPSAPQQSWELPVHHLNLAQQLLQPQPSPSPFFHPASTAVSSANVAAVAAATTANVPVTQSFAAPNLPVSEPETQRRIQNTLTPAQRERLKTITMPPHLQYHFPKSEGSPDSASSPQEAKGVTTASPTTLDPSKQNHDHASGTSHNADDNASNTNTNTNTRKRKSSADDDDDDDDEEIEVPPPVKKTAHNEIEKRYRTNLNDKIAALRDSVPSLRIMCKSARGEDTTEDREELHGLTPAHKLNKATVLSKATEYIKHLEKRNNRLIEEINSMQARIATFEKLFMAGAMTGQLPNPLQQTQPMQFNPASNPYMNNMNGMNMTAMNTPMATPQDANPPGMIPIPEDMKRIITAQQLNAGRPYPVPPAAAHFVQNPALLRQQHIQQQQQQAQARGWSPYFGKVMVGSLAGMMLIEALVENEKDRETTEGRGLFAIPVQLLAAFVRSTHFSIGGYYIDAKSIIAKLRLFTLLAIFLWVACSSFLDNMSFFRPPQKTKRAATAAAPVHFAPSLSSPLHVRRTAWLTAIQTVWVPQRNAFFEAAALLLKASKYALRCLIGDRAYLALTGLTEEQEAARVKAWSIALDAQLTGGDVDINKSRLTLTLFASGTLPDTPLRLMLKALHIRLLLWKLNGASWLANSVATTLARRKWNEARQLNQMIMSLVRKDTDDVLPEHLAVLLEQDCDDVLNDDIVQRAHNLAFNKPTTDDVMGGIPGMDSVVEDPAVRSPIDAVAAWYSTLLVHRALLNSLPKPQSPSDAAPAPTRSILNDVELAIKLAPIGSNAKVRALIARAVLVDGKRGTYIAAVLQALGPTTPYVKHTSAFLCTPYGLGALDADSHMALRCAMAMAQLGKFKGDLPRAAYMLIESILPHGCDIKTLSLLGYTAAFHLMEEISRHIKRDTCTDSMERLAGQLRIWIGSEEFGGGKVAGMTGEMRMRMVSRCLAVTKSVVGIQGAGCAVVDQGYVSMEDEDSLEDDGSGC